MSKTLARDRRFVLGQEIEQQGRNTGALQGFGDEGVARAEAAAAAAMREQHDPAGRRRGQSKQPLSVMRRKCHGQRAKLGGGHCRGPCGLAHWMTCDAAAH